MVVPDRTYNQRMDALEKGNVIRVRRARLKRDVKAGRIKTADLLENPPEFVVGMKVWDLLLATPKYGRVKVNKIFFKLQISNVKTVGGLSDRQRRVLVAEFRK